MNMNSKIEFYSKDFGPKSCQIERCAGQAAQVGVHGLSQWGQNSCLNFRKSQNTRLILEVFILSQFIIIVWSYEIYLVKSLNVSFQKNKIRERVWLQCASVGCHGSKKLCVPIGIWAFLCPRPPPPLGHERTASETASGHIPTLP